MTFKKESDIYADLVTDFQIYLGFEPGKVIKAILRVIAASMRLVYVVCEFIYWNIFATYADRAALRRMYEDWGLEWNSPTTAQARKTILNMYRQKGVGTKKWFADTVLFNFSEVTTATVQVNQRGLNTIDITVLYHNHPVPADIISQIQAFFDADDKKICGVSVLIKTFEPQTAL